MKIIQLLLTPNNHTWQGKLLGLGDDGVTYFFNNNESWEQFIPLLTPIPKLRERKTECQYGGIFPCNPCCEEFGSC